jgi:hypothetical protein
LDGCCPHLPSHADPSCIRHHSQIKRARTFPTFLAPSRRFLTQRRGHDPVGLCRRGPGSDLHGSGPDGRRRSDGQRECSLDGRRDLCGGHGLGALVASGPDRWVPSVASPGRLRGAAPVAGEGQLWSIAPWRASNPDSRAQVGSTGELRPPHPLPPVRLWE